MNELLFEPFGPYFDELFLSDTCKSIPSRVLGLQSLMLECRGKPTGLTETEHLLPEDRPDVPVRFRGILEIGNIRWLTQDGQKQLNEDIRRRHRKSHGSASSPDIAKIYKIPGGRKVKVWIQGYKNMSAGYLTSDLVPNGLMLTTRDRNRHYGVLSMDTETYTRSELFLDRYRVLHSMHHIINGDAGKTHVLNRNIDFFVKGYFLHCAYPEENRMRRLLFKRNDKDLDPAQEGAGGLLKKTRLLRQVHRAEVYAMFAEHAEWIREEQRARQKQRRIVDLEVWNGFIKYVKQQRVKASRQGVQWGVPAGYYASDADEREEEEEEEMDVGSSALPTSDPHPESSSRKRKLAPSPPLLTTPPLPKALAIGASSHLYDPDFSPPSSPSDSTPASSLPPSPSLLASYPKWGLTPPRLGADLMWSCPDPDCEYSLDVSKLRDAFRKRGRLNMERVGSVFEQAVFRHWLLHLDEQGLEWVNDKPEGSSIRRKVDPDRRW